MRPNCHRVNRVVPVLHPGPERCVVLCCAARAALSRPTAECMVVLVLPEFWIFVLVCTDLVLRFAKGQRPVGDEKGHCRHVRAAPVRVTAKHFLQLVQRANVVGRGRGREVAYPWPECFLVLEILDTICVLEDLRVTLEFLVFVAHQIPHGIKTCAICRGVPAVGGRSIRARF